MTNINIWNEIRNLKGRTLKTLDRQKEFEIFLVNESRLVVSPHSTRKERPIMRSGVENAWQRLYVTGSLSPVEIDHEFSSNNSAYVAAIFAELPGVRFTKKPITLHYKSE
jgi:hypothetical protein